MVDWCSVVKLAPVKFRLEKHWYVGGVAGPNSIKEARGVLTAVDAMSGKPAWRYRCASPMVGGVTPTAGGVTFTGDIDGNFQVFESRNGKRFSKLRSGRPALLRAASLRTPSTASNTSVSPPAIRHVFGVAKVVTPSISVYSL